MKKLLIAAAVTGLFSVNAFAVQPYIQLQAGQAEVDEDISDDSDTYLGLGLGFKATENLAFEVGYKDFGEASDEGEIEGYSAKATAETTAITFAAVGILPLGPSAELFGKVGFDVWEVEYSGHVAGYGDVDVDDEDGTDLFLALGAAFNITETTDIHIEYQRHDVDDTDLDVFAVGVNFGF